MESPPHFHRFVDLPIELRVQIWRAAFSPRIISLFDEARCANNYMGVRRLLPKLGRANLLLVNWEAFRELHHEWRAYCLNLSGRRRLPWRGLCWLRNHNPTTIKGKRRCILLHGRDIILIDHDDLKLYGHHWHNLQSTRAILEVNILSHALSRSSGAVCAQRLFDLVPKLTKIDIRFTFRIDDDTHEPLTLKEYQQNIRNCYRIVAMLRAFYPEPKMMCNYEDSDGRRYRLVFSKDELPYMSFHFERMLARYQMLLHEAGVITWAGEFDYYMADKMLRQVQYNTARRAANASRGVSR